VSLHESEGILGYDCSLGHERLLLQLCCLALLHDSLHDEGASIAAIATSFHLEWHCGCRLTVFDIVSLLLTLTQFL